MKLIIDINATTYHLIREFRDLHRSDSEIVIRNGTPLSSLTNGEVLMKMYGVKEENMVINEVQRYVSVFFDDESSASFSLDWWEMKWKENAK